MAMLQSDAINHSHQHARYTTKNRNRRLVPPSRYSSTNQRAVDQLSNAAMSLHRFPCSLRCSNDRVVTGGRPHSHSKHQHTSVGTTRSGTRLSASRYCHWFATSSQRAICIPIFICICTVFVSPLFIFYISVFTGHLGTLITSHLVLLPQAAHFT